MKPKIPNAITHGHEILCAELEDVIAEGGKPSEKAKSIKEAMEAHFKKEEEYALPPLGLLIALTEGGWEISTEEAIKMADNLKSNMTEVIEEHKKIAEILKELKLIAEETDSFVTKQFCKSLTLHMELEDEVLYPATLLIGKYLKKISKG